jgi:hypothetical protein
MQSRNARYWRCINSEKELGISVRLLQPDRSKCLKFFSSRKAIGSDRRDVMFFNTILLGTFMIVPIHSRKRKNKMP